MMEVPSMSENPAAKPVKDAAPKPPPLNVSQKEQGAIAAQIIGVKTAAEWRQLSEHIKENGRPETDTWFNDQMESKAATLSNAELETLWPQIIVNDPAQAYRIAKRRGCGAHRGTMAKPTQICTTKSRCTTGKRASVDC